MKIAVIGSGGREHTLAWKIAKDACTPKVYCLPGNAGTAVLAENINIGAENIKGIIQWCIENKPDLVVVGPEAPLCAGLADDLIKNGIRVFGPTQDAARMEGSKAFAKEIMISAGVPTAESQTFTDADKALAYVRTLSAPPVVKADGIAAGKGVIVASSFAEAERAIQDILKNKVFGEVGGKVVIEECLEGPEISVLALIDGRTIIPLAASQDHKRIFDGDKGPNTGGMGAYSPVPGFDDTMLADVRKKIFVPVLDELNRRGIIYRGVLYAGLMLTQKGPMVLEFNCRFGDPETQALLPRLDCDIVPLLTACADGNLLEKSVIWKPEACACVVMSSQGYPGKYETGKVIGGLQEAESIDGVQVFHSGTKLDGSNAATAGGRVLAVSALGADLRAAVDKAYKAVSLISFDGAYYRKDIAYRAFSSESI